MASVLSVRRLYKTFAGTQVLRAVDFDLQAGEIRALVGQNGSGKSTMVKILAGFHEPDTGGVIEVAGVRLPTGRSAASEAAGLRFVHQDLGLVLTMDTTENLALGPGYEMRATGLINWRASRRHAERALAQLGYDLDVRRPVAELTVAERTAVAVARALSRRATQPRVLVLDEPTASMPAPERERLFTLVRSVVRESGVAVLFVSHDIREVFDLCDTVTVLRDGEHIVTRGTPGLTEAKLVTLMIGRELEMMDVHPTTPAGQGALILEVDSLSTAVLRQVSFAVRAGEVVGVAGVTGSGREQIALAVFGGIHRSGRVLVQGKPLPASRPDLSIEAGAGLVPADRHANAAFMHSNLRENISIADRGGFLRRVFQTRRSEKSDVSTWLIRLRVQPPHTESSMEELSGGNQQKVVLARWLRRRPRLLILDEPTQGVDVGAKADIHAMVDQSAASGAAVLVVSTDNAELARLCDRVIVLAGGRIADELRRPTLDADLVTAATLVAGRGA